MGSPAASARAPRLAALCVRTLPELRPGGRRLNVQAATDAGKLKSIDELPGPSLSTTLYWLFVRGYADKSHLLQGLQRSLYGPIWRSRFGPYDIVNVATPELIAQVIHQEGRYPVRAELPHWKEYLDLRGRAYGLHVHTGPAWYNIRSALNPKMLKLREVSSYAPIIHQVVGDLLRRIELLRSRSRDQATVSDVAAELYKFGFEGISSILFETRLGCLQEEIPKDTLRFITAVNNMLTLSETVVLFPRWSRGVLPLWNRFVQAWDDLYDVARTLIDRRVAEIEAQVCGGEPAEGMYLTYLLSSDKLSRAEVYISITELLLGGVDTTSNTLSWALYHLAKGYGVPAVLCVFIGFSSHVTETLPWRRVADLHVMISSAVVSMLGWKLYKERVTNIFQQEEGREFSGLMLTLVWLLMCRHSGRAPVGMLRVSTAVAITVFPFVAWLYYYVNKELRSNWPSHCKTAI